MIAAPVVELQEVQRSYGTTHGLVRVLRGVNLQVHPGEFLIITGPSGSGKTTLLNLMCLLEVPSEGRVVFEGRDVSSAAEDDLCSLRKHRVGVVFQRFHLLGRRSVLENVAFRFRYLDVPKDEVLRKSMKALETVGMAPLADRPARVLSVGEMQRVAIARAVAMAPALLVADEPTGNLDRETGNSIMECFSELHRRGLTTVMVTHNESLLSHATRHLVCRDGVVK